MDNTRIEGDGQEATGASKGHIRGHINAAADDRSQQVEDTAERHGSRAEQMIDAMADRMRGNAAGR